VVNEDSRLNQILSSQPLPDNENNRLTATLPPPDAHPDLETGVPMLDDSTGVGSAGGARPSRRRPSRGDIRATVHRLVHSTTASAAGQADIQSQVDEILHDRSRRIDFSLAGSEAAENLERSTAEPRNSLSQETSETQTPAGEGESSSQRHNLDISLLARHIEHMQRICRASLEDLPQSRQRRQVIRLQGIRRMLEDLHRQIRNLQSTVQGAVGAAQEAVDALAGSGSRLAPLTSPTRRSEFTIRSSRRRSGLVNRNQGVLANRSRLTRAQSMLYSRLHATVRAMEMSPDLARRGISPVNDSLAEASQSVMERHEAAANAAGEPQQPSSTLDDSIGSIDLNHLAWRNRSSRESSPFTSPSTGDIAELARNDLRSMSQRLERILRDRREATERSSRIHFSHREELEREADQPDLDLRTSHRSRVGLDLPPLLLDSSTPSDSEDEGFHSTPQSVTSSVPPPVFTRHSLARTSFAVRRPNQLERENLSTLVDDDLPLQTPRTAGEASLSLSSSTGPRPGTSSLSSRPPRDPRTPASLSNPLFARGPRRYHHQDRLNRMRAGDRLASRFEERERRFRAQGPPSERHIGPLSDLIWRSLRRRSLYEEEDREDRNRHREALGEMVDQLTIDHDTPENQDATPGAASSLPPSSGVGAAPPPVPAREEGGGPHRPLHFLPSNRLYERLNRMLDMARLEERRARMHEFHPMHHLPSSALTHRIQTWDFWSEGIPDISRTTDNVVVKEAKIHNDASVDISEDGGMLVTLAPCNLPMTTVVGLYSLDKNNLGQVLATYSLESCAVSVSLSPTSKHLLVGLTQRTRMPPDGPADRPLMAQVFKIRLPTKKGERGRLIHRKDINQIESGHNISLNCIRWIPVAGQGLVFANNTGLLNILT